jgi:hypothetical protein
MSILRELYGMSGVSTVDPIELPQQPRAKSPIKIIKYGDNNSQSIDLPADDVVTDPTLQQTVDTPPQQEANKQLFAQFAQWLMDNNMITKSTETPVEDSPLQVKTDIPGTPTSTKLDVYNTRNINGVQLPAQDEERTIPDEIDPMDKPSVPDDTSGWQDSGTGEQDADQLDNEDPNKQGMIRTVPNAHLVYKRKTDEGQYTELWIFNNSTSSQVTSDIKRKILAGTDIEPTKTSSEDNTQSYVMWIVGNITMLQIEGLPN